jgi:hypothetical protein
MRRFVSLLGISGFAIGAIWLARVRRRGGLPGIVTHRFNPLVMRFGLAGGRRSPWAVLEHVGRTSGITYHTPISILASERENHVFIRLSYGPDVHWVKNVQAAGHCRLQLHESILELDEPAVVAAGDNVLIPPRMRDALDRAGRSYLRLHVLERVAGTFTRPRPGPEAEPVTIQAPAIEMLHIPSEPPREPARS